MPHGTRFPASLTRTDGPGRVLDYLRREKCPNGMARMGPHRPRHSSEQQGVLGPRDRLAKENIHLSHGPPSILGSTPCGACLRHVAVDSDGHRTVLEQLDWSDCTRAWAASSVFNRDMR